MPHALCEVLSRSTAALINRKSQGASRKALTRNSTLCLPSARLLEAGALPAHRKVPVAGRYLSSVVLQSGT